MKGIVSCFTPEEAFEIILKYRSSGFALRYSSDLVWWYTEPTVVAFRINHTSKETAELDHYEVLRIEVPRKLGTEIWSQICVIDGEITESIVFEKGYVATVRKGVEKIMEKLNHNFEKGILSETEYNQSIRVLKVEKFKQLFKN